MAGLRRIVPFISYPCFRYIAGSSRINSLLFYRSFHRFSNQSHWRRRIYFQWRPLCAGTSLITVLPNITKGSFISQYYVMLYIYILYAGIGHDRYSQPILPSSTPIETSRMMLPDDTNSMGNVHGGTILKLIEQAGYIVATRHCNSNNKSRVPLTTILARVEHMDFHKPMYVGEIGQVQAAVTYTSPHSIEVTVDVWAENTLTGVRRHTNSARLWYVAVTSDIGLYEKPLKPMPVPQLSTLSKEEFEAGRRRYEMQKEARKTKMLNDKLRHFEHSQSDMHDLHSVPASQTTLTNVVLPSDCATSGHMLGGALMKMMDSAAGICSIRHCRTPAVTISLEAINFISPIFNGDLVFVTAEIIFTSAKSMTIEVHVEAEGLRSESPRRVTNHALFTFVSIDENGKARDVPKLKLSNQEEENKFEEMKRIYEARKKERMRTTKD